MVTGKRHAVLTGHTGAVRSVCFSPDGRTLASAGGTAGSRGELKLWDLHAGPGSSAPVELRLAEAAADALVPPGRGP